MSRRGAVKFNPVTGKMERMDAEEAAAKRDGCMRVDERYVNAAKELGLGGGDGMYTHIKSLVRVGGGDIPHGSSIEKEGGGRSTSAPSGGEKGEKLIDAKDFDAVKATLKTTVTQVGRAKVAGFSSGGAKGPSIHDHEDSFQRRKGVVNTIGGARDVTRKVEDAKLPPKGTGARIAGFDTMDTHSAEGKARREAQEKRMAAAAKGRAASAGAPASASAATARAGARGGPAGALPKGGGGVQVFMPSKKPLGATSSNVTASASSSVASKPTASAGIAGDGATRRATGSTNVLGGGSSAGGPPPAGGGSGGAPDAAARAAMAEKRAAFFAAKFAEDKAKKAAAAGSSDE